MSKVYHAVYLTIIGALAIVIVGLLTPRSTDVPDYSSNHRVAVLPFRAMDSAAESFATELTADLVASLGEFEFIEIVPESELQPKIRSAENHHLWANELLVSLILEGSVRRSGHNIQVVVQLIDGPTSMHVWSESYVTTPDQLDNVLASIEDQVLVVASR